jgi:hypothetical protein
VIRAVVVCGTYVITFWHQPQDDLGVRQLRETARLMITVEPVGGGLAGGSPGAG